jgi:hypothetical protein
VVALAHLAASKIADGVSSAPGVSLAHCGTTRRNDHGAGRTRADEEK